MAKVSSILGDKGFELISTPPSTSLLNAVRHMIEKKVGALLVVQKDNDEITGIFTERDFLRAALQPDRSLVEQTVGDFMTTDLVIVTPDWEIDDCLAVMTQKRCRHLPVLNQGKLVGLISIGDIGKFISRERETEIQYLKEYIQGKW